MLLDFDRTAEIRNIVEHLLVKYEAFALEELEEEELTETVAKANPWFDFEATGETDNPTETPARRTVRPPKGHENNPTQWLGGTNAETRFSKHTMTHNKWWHTIKPADMAKVMKGTERRQKVAQNPQHKKATTNSPPSNELTRESIDAMREAYRQVLLSEQTYTPPPRMPGLLDVRW
jgi:hypothetical protein